MLSIYTRILASFILTGYWIYLLVTSSRPCACHPSSLSFSVDSLWVMIMISPSYHQTEFQTLMTGHDTSDSWRVFGLFNFYPTFLKGYFEDCNDMICFHYGHLAAKKSPRLSISDECQCFSKVLFGSHSSVWSPELERWIISSGQG